LLIALAIALPAAQLGSDGRLIFVRFLVLGTICLIGWTSLTVLHLGANLYLRNFRIDAPHDLLACKHVTQVRVLMRVLDIIIVLVTLGFALMTFDTVRQYGIGVFASAGIAGVVFSLAAQPVLSNLIAEIQLAMTQPIRLTTKFDKAEVTTTNKWRTKEVTLQITDGELKLTNGEPEEVTTTNKW